LGLLGLAQKCRKCW